MHQQQSVYSHDIRDLQDAPLCGKFRVGAQNNPLLHKNHLGAVKPTVYDLPSATHFQHQYGLEQVRDGLTSADVVGGWAQYGGSNNTAPPRDFMTLNKMAASSGLTTTKGFGDFRKSHDVRLKLGNAPTNTTKPYDDSTTFGRSGTYGENFNDLVSHQFRFEWVSTQVPATELQAAAKSRKPGQTKTSTLNATTARAKLKALDEKGAIEKGDVAAPEQWKLSTFKNVPAKLGPTG